MQTTHPHPATYRDFSRRRYAELKETHGGRMRESEIIQKIIKEWDEMKAAKKMNHPRTPLKDQVELPIPQEKIQPRMRSTKAKDEEGEARMMEERMADIQVPAFQAEEHVSMSKSKMIRKSGRVSPYISFYKQNFDELRIKHPNWSATELTKIVGLMWRRQKQSSMTTKRTAEKMEKARPVRRMSGRMTFKRFKLKEGMEKQEIMSKWRHLPMESRKMYEMESNPAPRKPVIVTRSKANGLANVLRRK